MMKRFTKRPWWQVALVGGLCGVAYWLISEYPYRSAYFQNQGVTNLLLFVIAGVIAGLAFWLTTQGPAPSNSLNRRDASKSNGPRIVDMSINMVGSGDLSATISARFAGTGRTISADKVFGEVDTWSRLADPVSHPLYRRVQEALRACTTVSEQSLLGFRGRSLPLAVDVPSSEDFGPPPAPVAPPNRYNEAGRPALYLCTVREAVGRELAGAPCVGIQPFVVPVGSLRVADLRSPEANADQLLAAVMWFTELAGAEGHTSQDFSRFVSSMVAEQFDGMLVSGVRGDPSLIYSNLVMLNPGEEWRNWLSSEPPTLLERSVV